MSFQEFKEVIGTVFLISFTGTLVITYLLYKFAEITYKRAHKPVKKIYNVRENYAVVYEIECKNKTLQEVQAERLQMKRILGGV